MTAPATDATGTPVDRPLHNASLGEAFVRFWKKYAAFDGRASRSEFWWMMLVIVLVSTALYSVKLAATGWDPTAANAFTTHPADIPNYVWILATIIPILAVTVRRLHDVDRSGWWILFSLIPVVGWIILVIWHASPRTPPEAASIAEKA